MQKQFISGIAITISLILSLNQITYSQKVKDIDGVINIYNDIAKWGNKPEVRLEYSGTFGELESDNANYMFFQPEDIIEDKKGNIYVLDSGNLRIQKFNNKLEYLSTLGCEGQGPGEFSRPTAMDIDNVGNIHVTDPGNLRIQVISSNGENVKTLSFKNYESSSFTYFKILKNGNYLMRRILGNALKIGALDNYNGPPPLFKTISKTGEFLAEIGKPTDFGNEVIDEKANSLFFTIDNDNNIFASFESQNKITKYNSNGEAILNITRKLNYDDKFKLKDEEIGNRKIQVADVNMVSRGIDIDSYGRIWVATARRQIKEEEIVEKVSSLIVRNGQIDVRFDIEGNTDLLKTDMWELELFSREGVLLAKYELDHFCDGLDIIGDRIFIRDNLRGMRYYVYNIVDSN